MDDNQNSQQNAPVQQQQPQTQQPQQQPVQPPPAGVESAQPPQENQPQQAPEENIQDDAIVWEASEFVHSEKSIGWFLLFLFGGIGLSVIMYIFIDLMAGIAVLFISIAMLVYGKLKPNNMTYAISDRGLAVGNRQYAYSEFKYFSLMSENGVNSIYLTPMEKYMIPLSIFIPPESQDQIVNVITEHLPNKPHEPDFMDKLLKNLRF